MSAVARDIADAVVAKLNVATFSQSFTAVRAYRPERTLEDMEELQVIVIPSVIDIAKENRSQDQHEYQIEIGVFKKIDSDDPDEVDRWVDFAEQLTDELRGSRLTNPSASYISIENNPIAAEEYLRKHVFASLITVVYRVVR